MFVEVVDRAKIETDFRNKKVSFDDLKIQAEKIVTIKENKILRWTKDFEPFIGGSFFSRKPKIFSDTKIISIIAECWVDSLKSVVINKNIELNEDEMNLFSRVKDTFNSISQLYKELFRHKNNVLKLNEQNVHILASNNYKEAAKDLNVLLTAQRLKKANEKRIKSKKARETYEKSDRKYQKNPLFSPNALGGEVCVVKPADADEKKLAIENASKSNKILSEQKCSKLTMSALSISAIAISIFIMMLYNTYNK